MNTSNPIKTIDTHMAGSPTRIIIDGLPEIVGNTMMEKMEYFSNNLDHYRKMLILEPRGHKNMWGAVITEPCDPNADIGVFFLTSEGCFPTCVHSKISLVTACIEKGIIEAPKKGEPVKVEIPLGITNVYPNIVDGKVKSVAVESRGAFVKIPNIKVLLETGNFIKATVVYSGVYIMLIDVNQVGFYDERNELLKSKRNMQKLVSCAQNLINQVNKKYQLEDPRDESRTLSIKMAMFYDEINSSQANVIVITSSGSVDRCPCGSAAGAKLAELYHEQRIGKNQRYELIGPIGTTMSGEIIREGKMGFTDTVMPSITGSAYITGEHIFYMDEQDTISTGFML